MKAGPDAGKESLDGSFAEARAQPSIACDDLLARVIADADRLQRQPAINVRRHPVARPVGFWGKLAVLVGGKGVLAGLGTAALSGIVIGFAQPAPLIALTDTFFAQAPLDEIELLPGIDAILTEG